MSIRSALFALCTLVFVSAARAEDVGSQLTSTGPADSVGSEYLHQALGGNFELTPGLAVIGFAAESKTTSGVKVNKTTVPVAVKAEYGFTDMFSIAAKLGAALGTTDFSCPSNMVCNDTVHNGVMDPVLSANVRIPVGIAAIRFGADLSFSLGDYKIEDDGDTNMASGGTKFTPYIGADFMLGRSYLGVKISHDLYKGDRSVTEENAGAATDKYKITEEKETTYALFYEYNFPKIVAIGAALEFLDSPTSKTKNSTGTTSNNDAAKMTALNVYVPLRFTSRVTLVPNVAVGAIDYKSSSVATKNHTMTNVGVIARFAF